MTNDEPIETCGRNRGHTEEQREAAEQRAKLRLQTRVFIAQDQDGNIALGYSAAGADLFPSVRYTTRMAGDAPGTMPGF